MFSIELKVNGIVVASFQGYREIEDLSGPTPRHTYSYRGVSFPVAFHRDPKVYDGLVEHDYQDGLVALARRVLQDAEDQEDPPEEE